MLSTRTLFESALAPISLSAQNLEKLCPRNNDQLVQLNFAGKNSPFKNRHGWMDGYGIIDYPSRSRARWGKKERKKTRAHGAVNKLKAAVY